MQMPGNSFIWLWNPRGQLMSLTWNTFLGPKKANKESMKSPCKLAKCRNCDGMAPIWAWLLSFHPCGHLETESYGQNNRTNVGTSVFVCAAGSAEFSYTPPVQIYQFVAPLQWSYSCPRFTLAGQQYKAKGRVYVYNMLHGVLRLEKSSQT